MATLPFRVGNENCVPLYILKGSLLSEHKSERRLVCVGTLKQKEGPLACL